MIWDIIIWKILKIKLFQDYYSVMWHIIVKIIFQKLEEKKNSPLMLFNRLTRHKHYKRRLFAKSTSVIKINKNRTYMSINILKYKNKYFTTVYFHNFQLILPIGYQDLLAFISLCLGKPLAHQKKVCHYLSKWLFTPELVNFLFIIKTIIF